MEAHEVRTLINEARQAQIAVEQAQVALVTAGRKRQQALLALRHLGWTLQEIGDAVGIGRSRVSQILTGKRP